MVSIETVRESNAKAESLQDLVAVFVGGTGGIGERTAKEFVRRTTRPNVYIVGRNTNRGIRIIDELHELNPGSRATFLKCDISLLQNVDELCAELHARETQINCLFLTAGFMSLHGRSETGEGLDRKMVVNYYARMRFIANLMDLLTAASDRQQLSRVISVLAAGSEGDIRLNDLDLEQHFTLHACLAHCTLFTDFMVQEFARRYPGTSFSHSFPGTVKTGIANALSGPARLAVKVVYAVMASWIIDLHHSGERHFFQITSGCYPARRGAAGGAIPPPDDLGVLTGADGVVGGGSYLLDWDCLPTGDENILRKYRDVDFGTTIWQHTAAMFARAQLRMIRKESKRPTGEEPDEQPRRNVPNPIGWRPAS